MKITSWFFDFDDTLASAPLTWTLNMAIPKLIAQHNLPVEQAQLDRAILTAQERWRSANDLTGVLGGLFSDMNWSNELQTVFMNDLRTNYQPTLFDDALFLLQALAQTGHLVYVISNNKLAPVTARDLGIGAYIREIFTPHMFSDVKSKPDPSIWHAILDSYPALRETDPVFVGDDPWTDGTFAEACGMTCWIVDRPGRMASMYGSTSCKWVRSLRDIPIT